MRDVYHGDIFRPGERVTPRAIMTPRVRFPFFNICARKVGGLLFIKIGRVNVSLSISKEYRPL